MEVFVSCMYLPPYLYTSLRAEHSAGAAGLGSSFPCAHRTTFAVASQLSWAQVPFWDEAGKDTVYEQEPFWSE